MFLLAPNPAVVVPTNSPEFREGCCHLLGDGFACVGDVGELVDPFLVCHSYPQ